MQWIIADMWHVTVEPKHHLTPWLLHYFFLQFQTYVITLFHYFPPLECDQKFQDAGLKYDSAPTPQAIMELVVQLNFLTSFFHMLQEGAVWIHQDVALSGSVINKPIYTTAGRHSHSGISEIKAGADLACVQLIPSICMHYAEYLVQYSVH